MKLLQYIALSFLIAGLFSVNGIAQDNSFTSHTVNVYVPDVAIMDLESYSGTSISLSPLAPAEAGLALDFSAAKDNSIWINYTSIVGSASEPNRNISVQITGGQVPSGVDLTLESSSDAGMGEGTMGAPVSRAITLDNTPQKIITNIGSAFTGDGVNSGHNLTYQLNKKPGSFGQLDFDQNNTITISYTLSDN